MLRYSGYFRRCLYFVAVALILFLFWEFGVRNLQSKAKFRVVTKVRPTSAGTIASDNFEKLMRNNEKLSPKNSLDTRKRMQPSNKALVNVSTSVTRQPLTKGKARNIKHGKMSGPSSQSLPLTTTKLALSLPTTSTATTKEKVNIKHLSVVPKIFSIKQTEKIVTPTTLLTTKRSTLLPITIPSWSEVYGETGCSTNSWRPILLDLFEEWTKIAKKHNIEYMIFYGSLLGALRTGDVIPWDSDIDLLMDVKYFPKMKEIAVKRGFDISDGKIRFVVQPEFDHNVSSNARKRYTCKGKLTPNMVDQCSFQEPFGRLVLKYLHIDFYQFYNKGDYIEDPSEDDLKKYKTKDIFPLRPCKFMGFDAFCPNKPWTVLKQYFRTNNLESKYKCKNKKWQDKNGKVA